MTDWVKLLLPYWAQMRLRNELLRRDPAPLHGPPQRPAFQIWKFSHVYQRLSTFHP